MNKEIQIEIQANENSLPVKAVLSKRAGLSRREISRLKFSHGILLNGESCRVTQPVKTGDIVTLIFQDHDLAHAARMSGKPDILYEDEDIVIVNKPTGMVCHPTHEHQDDDMGTLLQNYYAESFTVRAIGRLDKDVSGIMVYAKNQPAAARLSKERQKQVLKKTYHAIVKGHFPSKTGTFTYALKKENGRKDRIVSEGGQKCITHYRVIQEFDDYTLIAVQIETGRTHQIRAGFAHFDHTLLGDALYGGDVSLISRPALHCADLLLEQPFTHKAIHVTCDEPNDMQKLITKTRK